MTLSNAKNRESGSVLIIVLVLMMVGTSLAMYTVSLSREMVAASQQLNDKLLAKLEAASIKEKLIYIGTTGRFSSWNIENSTANKEFPLQLNLRNSPFVADNTQIRLQDSAGRFGLWPPNIFYLKKTAYHLGLKPGETETAVDSLLDWTDEDDLKHLNGAESYYYRAEQSKKYLPRNDRFIQDTEELALIKGWRGLLFDKLADEIIPTSTGTINLNTADSLLLSGVLDVPTNVADSLLQLREKNGIISRYDIMTIAPNALTNMDEYITNFPSMTVAVDIRTTVGGANDQQRAVISFRGKKDNPFTIEQFVE